MTPAGFDSPPRPPSRLLRQPRLGYTNWLSHPKALSDRQARANAKRRCARPQRPYAHARVGVEVLCLSDVYSLGPAPALITDASGCSDKCSAAATTLKTSCSETNVGLAPPHPP